MEKSPTQKKIVMLAGEGDYSLWVYNYLTKKGIILEHVIIEKPVNRLDFLKKRSKKMGGAKVLGQLLNRILVVTLLKLGSKKRVKEIMIRADLDNTLPVKKDTILNVSSVNSVECLNLLKKIEPYLVVVVNTRIISKKLLSTINAKFINIHAGITPKYRGWHGAYWALVNNDRENCGVTIHMVDEGVDTGGILYQEKIEITGEDNYFTYPLLQLEQGLPILQRAIMDIVNGTIKVKPSDPNIEDGLYSHPTIWEYLSNRAVKKIK